METLILNLKLIFNFSTIIVYLLGTITFSLTLLIDWLSPNRTLKKFNWYLSEFLYSTISIFLGMFVCLAFETSQSVIYVIGIIMGLIGSTIIKKFISKREQLANKVLNKVEDKIDKN